MASNTKKTYVSDLSELVVEAKHFALIKFDNTSHLTLEKLRKQLKKEGASLKVVKNSLFEKAIEKMIATKKDLKELKKFFPLRDTSAILTLDADYSKALSSFFNFAKKEGSLSFKFGLLDATLYQGPDLEKIAQLPSKDILLAKLIGGMKAPSSKLVFSLKYNVGKLVYILKERSKQAN